MKHLLLTKFAMRFSEDNPRRRYERVDWLDYRIDLFQRYCVPSVQAQTVKEFDWWFLINSTFPGLSPRHLDTLSQYGRILYVDAPWNEAQPEVGELLNRNYNNQWVCSSKLDSDDMLANNFFEMLQREVTEKEEWISFRYGYIIKDRYAALRDYAVNPFLSYVEFASPLKTVFNQAHNVADRSSVPFRVVPQIGWAQVDHGDNIKNRAYEKVKNFDSVKVPIETLETISCT